MDRINISNVFATRIASRGLSITQVFQHAQLPEDLLHDDKIVLSTRQVFALWNAIGELSGDPAIGLKIGSDPHVERYHPISTAALAARTFRDALTQLGRYKQMICSEEVRLTDHDSHVMVEFHWLRATDTEPLLLLDSAFASVVELGRRGTGQSTNPEWVEFSRPVQNVPMYEAHFGCPIHFGSNRNALIYTVTAIERPFVTHNPDLLGLLAPQLESAFAEYSAHRSLTERVKPILKRLLAGQRATVKDVADELHMSLRTLQRKLSGDGVSFQQLLEGVRCEMAQHYLRESNLDLTEISFLLGYEEANSFHRAFHAWTGFPPGEWRSRTVGTP